ncbi:MAG TPA: cytochrome P450 [Allosphingosinicella sp.]|uniref:cytochrome P450 n=1 Tax=Allosphingosinicella sp. TaxID=2823234 RepID=UPI002ED9B0DA
MGRYLDQLDTVAPDRRWAMVRGWLLGEPLPFFAELRAERPVLVLPDVTLATRYHDCAAILHRHKDFGVDLYRPKQGDYFMAQDDTADHWRDKSIMKSILDFEQVPAMRAFVGKTTNDILDAAGCSIDAPKQLTRAVPIALVQRFFGFDGSDPNKLLAWSYWNQQDAFHNQPFDIDVPDPDHIVAERKRANIHLAFYVGRLVAKRAVQAKLGARKDDPVSRLIRLSFTGALNFPLKKVLFNVGGLLIGAVETTSHTVNNAIAELFRHPAVLDRARAAAREDDPTKFDGYVFEALRFNPAFPYFFRTCHRSTLLASGTPFATEVEPGTTVLAVTHSAMFDEAAFPDAERFNPVRSPGDTFTFGYGIHECLGRAVAAAMVPEIVRQCLCRTDFHPESAPIFEGGVPEHYRLAWRD